MNHLLFPKMIKITHSIIVILFYLVIDIVGAQQAQQPLLAPSSQVCQPLTTKPAAKVEKYHFNQGNSTNSCIVAQFAAHFEVGPGQYIELNNSSVSTNISSCQKLVIQFDCGELEFGIGQTVNDSRTFVNAINGKLQLVANTTQLFSNSTPTFYSSKDHSFKCTAEQKIPLQTQNSTQKYELVLSNFILEAFRNATGTEFYQTPDECTLDSQPVSDLVRIGVGICLVALVAIVLVAYFIGRRRWSERSSYESV